MSVSTKMRSHMASSFMLTMSNRLWKTQKEMQKVRLGYYSLVYGLLHFEDLFMMGVRLVPEICSAGSIS